MPLSIWRRISDVMEERAAEIYEIAGDPGKWRIRIRKYPELHGWTGGRILWGHDQPSEKAAARIAARWVTWGKLPCELCPFHPLVRQR